MVNLNPKENSDNVSFSYSAFTLLLSLVVLSLTPCLAQQQQRWSEIEGKPASSACPAPPLGANSNFARRFAQDFSDRIESGLVKRQGDWLVAEGFAPNSGGSDEAAFAINVSTGMVFAIMWVDGQQVRSFGVDDLRKLPPPLLEWYRERGGVGCSGTSCTDYGIQRAAILDVVKASLSGNKNGATASLDGPNW